MLPLLALVLVLWAEPCLQEDGGFALDGDVRRFSAAAAHALYVATEEKLYQLSRDLVLVRSLSLRGLLKVGTTGDEFLRVSEASGWNATFRVHVLLPFVANKSLISCGSVDNGCGHCEVLDLNNINNIIHSESIQVGPLDRSSGSVAFLVRLEKIGTFILTAAQKNQKQHKCPNNNNMHIHNTGNKQHGDIFSVNGQHLTPSIGSGGDVEFVDGFQINSTIYLLSNVQSGPRTKVRLIWLEAKHTKTLTLQSLRGATLVGGSRLVASSVIPGGPQVLWSGVFSMGGDGNTSLVVFDISPDLSLPPNKDPDFYYSTWPEPKKMEPEKPEPKKPEPKKLEPKKVLLRQSYLTSVLAVRQRAWMVFFMGTSDGQLIKLVVDKNFRPACVTVLHRADDSRPVFPSIHLDPVDRRHLYVALRRQVKRVPVSNCSASTELRECLSAQDPNCVWCPSKRSCTFEGDCDAWLSMPEDFQDGLVSHRLMRSDAGRLTLTVHTHLTTSEADVSNFACQFLGASGDVCDRSQAPPPPQFPRCTCILQSVALPDEGLNLNVRFRLGSISFTEQLKLNNCSNIRGSDTSHLCERCVKSGCGWSNSGCSWANQGVANDGICQKIKSKMSFSPPEISSISPSIVSFYGRNHAVLSGSNLSHVTGVRIQRDAACSAHESPVWNNTGVNLTFHIPRTDYKGAVRACVVLPDGSCHGNHEISYQSSPSCVRTEPSGAWFSGKRTVTLIGSHLDFVEGVIHSHNPQKVTAPISSSSETLTYRTPAAKRTQHSFYSSVSLRVANTTLPCSSDFRYHPDPEFLTFEFLRRPDNVLITLQKKKDELEMTTEDLSLWGLHKGAKHLCTGMVKQVTEDMETFICQVGNVSIVFQQLMIQYGDKTITLDAPTSSLVLLVLLPLLLIPSIIVAVAIVYRRKQRKLTAEMNRIMEDLELDIRNDIRQGFVDLQTEKADLMENVGAIPFLDYKHFACRIFFPESDSLMASCVRDVGQDAATVQLEACCQDLSRLIRDQLFLTSMVHALEEQKSFTIKDKCSLASLLTVALHSDLSYLTEVMEALLKALMQQSGSAQPKLLLRRTESTVEKLLTNWMSICLYGFLRESVGQHLFLMVSALTQQIAKGPVDCVTEKALYTLNEDWLLWQAPDFTSLTLKVLFAVGRDGEVSEPLEVSSLSCDTVEQVKEKVLSTFRAKFGFPYNTALKDLRIEYEQDGRFLPLEEVDASSEVIEEVTMLNTLKHYKVPDGTTIKVLSKSAHPPLSPQGSLKDDENFSGKYFHLIDPDVVEDQRKNPERKKLKLKEVHLTKLLSTKVAVHSFVENLFKSIWGMQLNKAPLAVKYFFDFLDGQAENMKVTDPDVLHIWKTNSLPLRFWVNILKNPQFVFDMEKTPHLDGCLSVIAQAFMDSFSLSELQLGKHAPTNKLLYAKDIPKFKQEVKVYYKRIKEQSPVTESEFTRFLQEESKKHQNEFNEAGALRELYKYIQKYFKEIQDKLEQNGAPVELAEQLHHVKKLFDGLKSCSWN